MVGTIFLFLFLIALSAFFSGVEIAFFSLTRGRVRTMVRHKLSGAKLVERLKQHPNRLLIVIVLGYNIVSIFAAAVATQLSIQVFGSTGVGIATGVVTIFVLIFAEIFPKSFGQAYAREIARYTAPIIWILGLLLFPAVIVLEGITWTITRLIPATRRTGQHLMEEDIRSMLHIGVEEGDVEKHEEEFVDRLFKFDDKPVRDVLTPIDATVMLDGKQTVERVAHFVAKSGYSRFPVYKGGKNDIVGVVHVKDIVRVNNSNNRDKPVATIVKNVPTVKATLPLDNTFRQMQKTHTHYMLVEGEKGKVLGIVTLEDIIEELIGEIYDESDTHKTSAIT